MGFLLRVVDCQKHLPRYLFIQPFNVCQDSTSKDIGIHSQSDVIGCTWIIVILNRNLQQLYVMVLCDDQLGVVRSGDKSWTYIDTGLTSGQTVADVIQIHDKYYAVDNKGVLYICNMKRRRLEVFAPGIEDIDILEDGL